MNDIALPEWMGEVDPNQIGFPFQVDRNTYRKVTGIEYKRTASGPLALDAYLPNGGTAAPLVLMIHGGAWMGGGRFQMGLTKWAGYLAGAGLAVISIDYRLAPATSFPDSFQDCLDAVDWSVEHATELGIDVTRIALWGDSAGGHLALLLAFSQTHPGYSGPRMRCAPGALRAVAALYPPSDLLRLDAAERRGRGGGGSVAAFVGAEPAAEPERWQQASPIEWIHAALPPVLLLHGTRDILVSSSQSTRLAEQLARAGVPHRLEIVAEAPHGFDRVAPGEHARRLIADCRVFLHDHLNSRARG
jgi:acetyl esterase/lipase